MGYIIGLLTLFWEEMFELEFLEAILIRIKFILFSENHISFTLSSHCHYLICLVLDDYLAVIKLYYLFLDFLKP